MRIYGEATGSVPKSYVYNPNDTTSTTVKETTLYSQNFNIPLQFVVEDNNLSVHTPTDLAWGKRMEVPKDVIYYSYKMEYPHHGTGKWVNF